MTSLNSTGTYFYSKHTDTVTYLKYSSVYKLLYSGSFNGQICKWQYKDKKLQLMNKVYCYSTVNYIDVDDDLKVVGIGL